MLAFLIDYICVPFKGQVLTHSIGIFVGINFAPVNIFLPGFTTKRERNTHYMRHWIKRPYSDRICLQDNTFRNQNGPRRFILGWRKINKHNYNLKVRIVDTPEEMPMIVLRCWLKRLQILNFMFNTVLPGHIRITASKVCRVTLRWWRQQLMYKFVILWF